MGGGVRKKTGKLKIKISMGQFYKIRKLVIACVVAEGASLRKFWSKFVKTSKTGHNRLISGFTFKLINLMIILPTSLVRDLIITILKNCEKNRKMITIYVNNIKKKYIQYFENIKRI